MVLSPYKDYQGRIVACIETGRIGVVFCYTYNSLFEMRWEYNLEQEMPEAGMCTIDHREWEWETMFVKADKLVFLD